MKKRILAMPAAAPAIPANPKSAAINATSKEKIALPNIEAGVCDGGDSCALRRVDLK